MRKKSKKDKRRIMISFLVCCALFITISGIFFKYWGRILSNHNQTQRLKEEYTVLLSKEDLLKEEIKKLEDPDYVARYAREKYLYSKDGEIIFRIIK